MIQATDPFLRAVRLPEGVAGELWLGPMPGRLRPFTEDLAALAAQEISRIISLAPLAEIEEKAPAYAAALAGDTGIAISCFPIADFGVPEDEAGFFALARQTAAELRDGERVFVHCAAGIGRTGTVATCILLVLGLSLTDAVGRIAAAGSGPETEAQSSLVDRCAVRMKQPVETGL